MTLSFTKVSEQLSAAAVKRVRESQHRVSGTILFLDSFVYIRSCEHEHTLASSLVTHNSQANWQTSTVGTEFMDPALNTLIVALRAIRDQADSVLKKIEQ